MATKPLSFKEISSSDDLCIHCPLTSEGTVNTGPWNLCEGSHCDKAYEAYIEQFEEEEE